jgi:hypothetical protein
VTGAAPGKTLAEIAAANRSPNADFMIHPLPVQAMPQQPFVQSPPQFAQYGQPNQYGYIQPNGMYQQMPQYAAPIGAMPYPMQMQQQQPVYAQQQGGMQFPGPARPQMGQQQQQQQAQMPPQYQKSNAKPNDPFAGLWKTQ